MTNITRNILDFYKENESNNMYLKKLFTNTKNLGYYKPFAKDVVDSKWDGKSPNIGTIDEINTYTINEFGFRGENYQDSEVLAFGCSITFGLGVPESARWTNLLSNKINKSIMNLGSPGASVESISYSIIHYCLNNKMPKKIFCLMPDFFRRMVVADKEFYRTKRNNWAEKQNNYHILFVIHKLEFMTANLFLWKLKIKYI